MKTSHDLEVIRPFLKPDAQLIMQEGLPAVPNIDLSEGALANAYYFSNPSWMDVWLKYVHRYPQLQDRWHAAAGSWDDKVVVDIGCGPGNLFATVGGDPKALLGVDIAHGSLKIAKTLGYTPLLADVHDLPLRSNFADIVAVNGSMHHFDDMAVALDECARIVAPGGVLVVDHDPQRSAWHFRGIGRLLWELRRPIYRLLNRGGHSAEDDEQYWALRSELHHRPGDGLTDELLRTALEPQGFSVRTYPHNHAVGAEALNGVMGRQPMKIRMGQALSGINSAGPEGALSLLCVARRQP